MLKKINKLNKAHNREQFLKKNWLILLAVLYFFIPIDLIPDILPVVGLGDDILVLLATGIIKYMKHRRGNKKEKIMEGEIIE